MSFWIGDASCGRRWDPEHRDSKRNQRVHPEGKLPSRTLRPAVRVSRVRRWDSYIRQKALTLNRHQGGCCSRGTELRHMTLGLLG